MSDWHVEEIIKDCLQRNLELTGCAVGDPIEKDFGINIEVR